MITPWGKVIPNKIITTSWNVPLKTKPRTVYESKTFHICLRTSPENPTNIVKNKSILPSTFIPKNSNTKRSNDNITPPTATSNIERKAEIMYLSYKKIGQESSYPDIPAEMIIQSTRYRKARV